MTLARTATWQRDFGVDRAGYPGFFSHKDQLDIASSHTHVLQRAFDQLELDGILCSETTPLIYFKEVVSIQPHETLHLYRKFWNHGGAPILVLISPDEIHVYSGMSPPEPPDRLTDSPLALVDRLEPVATALKNFLISVETGAYFNQHASSFDTDNRVDRHLLANLRDTREALRGKLGKKSSFDFLDDLLCRLVFTCYLFDRVVIGPKYLTDLGIHHCNHLRDILRIQPVSLAKTLLYRLFEKLGEDFNGDLFSDNLPEEHELITDRHIDILNQFFHGTQVSTGQGSFWPYDFEYIPIETISAIYEHFLKDDGHRDGAFYTPRFLAEIVLDTALQGVTPLLGKKYLDPACGSGIFLVGLFNRLAAEWTIANPRARNPRRARELMLLIRKSLFGIDKNPIACRITAFSLYLAYLDKLSPRDIQKLQRLGRALPHLVGGPGYSDVRDADTLSRNIRCADFFLHTQHLPTNVDVVIGNPPWGGLASDKTPAGRWCKSNSRPIPDKQIAAAFIWKSTSHIVARGPICLVLPHGVLFNHSPTALAFQRSWVKRHRIEKILNLADLRFILFRDTIHPALVVRFRAQPPDSQDETIEYWTPKVDWTTTKTDVISVAPSSRATVKVRRVLEDLDTLDAPQIWNRHYWATPRDLRLLDRLSALPRLRDHVRASSDTSSDKRWVRAEGFQPLGPSDHIQDAKSLRLPARAYVSSRSPQLDLFLLPEDCQTLPSHSVLVRGRSNTNTQIFRAPHVLITRGFKRIAFANFDVSFRSTVRGIHGPAEDRRLLMFLAAYLRTNLARYFVFHTSSNWGVYRPEVHIEEFLRLPLPLPHEADDQQYSESIIHRVTDLLETASAQSSRNILARDNAVRNASAEIETLIDEYFCIQPLEKSLIEDTVRLIIPSVHATRNRMPVPTVKTASFDQCAAYTERVCSTLNGWSISSDYQVHGNSLVSERMGVGLVMLEKRPRSQARHSGGPLELELLETLHKIQNAVPTDAGSITPLRGVMVFDGAKLYIVKPSGQLHWSQTAAMNDADTLAATLLAQTPRDIG